MPSLCQRVAFVVAVGVMVSGVRSAQAALGGDVASVLHDHEALRAADVVTSTQQYDIHEASSTDGTHVRQYVNRSSGKVFAVAWDGPRLPDVGGLLGASATRYYAAARLSRAGHHVLSINDPDLSVTVLRLPRGWQGQAYLPAALPAGIDRSEIR
jgi:hypothetical protein